jgi:heterotetrameric sarcosine oxidase gamma subunit
VDDLRLIDESATPKWRTFDGFDVPTGTADRTTGDLVWSVSPGEWTALGARPDVVTVDLTHVRAMYRLIGEASAGLVNMVCALDLSDGMFPNGAAARTLFAGVTTELVRDDVDETTSYLILPSRSFGRYVEDVLTDAGAEFGLVQV